MPNRKLERQRPIVDQACQRLGLDYTGLARKLGLNPTTLTRPMNTRDWPHAFSDRTMRKIAALARIELPDLSLPAPRASARAEPRAVTLIVEQDAAGRHVYTLPPDSPIAADLPRLIRLFGALSPAQRQALLLQLQHPDLTPAGQSPMNVIAEGIRIGILQTRPDISPPELYHLIGEALAEAGFGAPAAPKPRREGDHDAAAPHAATPRSRTKVP